MTRIALALGAAAPLFACGAEVLATAEELDLDTGGGATAVAFVPVPEAPADVAVASVTRGQIDLYEPGPGGYRAFGSYFAGGAPIAVEPAVIEGRTSLVVRTADDTLYLLVGTGEPHRFAFPIRLGVRLDALAAIAVGDLDADGTDELVLAGEYVARVGELRRTVDARPEAPPPIERTWIDTEHAAAGVAIADADGSGLPDVLTVAADEPIARLYLDPAASDDDAPVVEIALPALGVAATRTACPEAPFLVLLADGRAVGVSGDGAVLERSVGEVERAAAGGDDVALVPGARDSLLIGDGCLEHVTSTDLAGASTGSVALSPRGTGARRLARLDRDGQRLSVHRILD